MLSPRSSDPSFVSLRRSFPLGLDGEHCRTALGSEAEGHRREREGKGKAREGKEGQRGEQGEEEERAAPRVTCPLRSS
jgi:hypothetical protein